MGLGSLCFCRVGYEFAINFDELRYAERRRIHQNHSKTNNAPP